MQAGLIQRYLGNKSAIADDIVAMVREFAEPGDIVVDAFSGSLAASFALRQAGLRVVSNDINHFSWLFATAFMGSDQPFAPNGRWATAVERREQWLMWANRMIAPIDDGEEVEFRSDIFDHYCEEGRLSAFESARGTSGRRRFFSAQNAATIDRALSRIRAWWLSGEVDQRTRCVLTAMLITAIEKISNTQGTYHDFPRQFTDSRALKPLQIELPPDEIFIGPASPSIGCEQDSLEFIKTAPSHRVLYLDPPYNFRQYTSYYFMLNLLSKHADIGDLDALFAEVEFVRGQNMVDDFKSTFCSKASFMPSLRTLIERADADYVVISYFDGRNHWGSFKADEADSQGRTEIERFLSTNLFEPNSARCIPIKRLNYQSYGGFKAKTVSEFLFSARKARRVAEEQLDGAIAWTGRASG